MLFAYPDAATQNNWLHECLCKIIETIHKSVDLGVNVPDWPEIVPDNYREILTSRTGLRKKTSKYADKIQMLLHQKRATVYDALINQNRITELLNGSGECDKIADLPISIQDPILDLFGFAFELLTEFDIRDQQYRCIYDALPAKVCPFCGLELFDAPGARREALDHYLAKSIYPFAAANLCNLIPMGNKCNSLKGAIDILWKNGVRRLSFDPYNPPNFAISLDNSQLFARENETLPDWVIEFYPPMQEIDTWDDVFDIRNRYARGILDPSFKDWIGDFRYWHMRSQTVNAGQSLANTINSYIDSLERFGFRDQSFLKVAVFRLFRKQVQQGNSRLIKLLVDPT